MLDKNGFPLPAPLMSMVYFLDSAGIKEGTLIGFLLDDDIKYLIIKSPNYYDMDLQWRIPYGNVFVTPAAANAALLEQEARRQARFEVSVEDIIAGSPVGPEG